MTHTTRPTQPSDVPALAALADQVLFPAAYFEPMIRPFFEGSGAIWLSALDCAPIGFAFAEPEAMTAATWNLRAIASHPPRKGTGRALLRRAEADIRATGGQLLVIDTTQLAEQNAARALYAAEGYQRCGHIPDFFGPGEDKITFAKALI